MVVDQCEILKRNLVMTWEGGVLPAFSVVANIYILHRNTPISLSGYHEQLYADSSKLTITQHKRMVSTGWPQTKFVQIENLLQNENGMKQERRGDVRKNKF